MQENRADHAIKIDAIPNILRKHRPAFKCDLRRDHSIGAAPTAEEHCDIYKDQTIGDDGFSVGWIVISKGQKHGLKVTDTV